MLPRQPLPSLLSSACLWLAGRRFQVQHKSGLTFFALARSLDHWRLGGAIAFHGLCSNSAKTETETETEIEIESERERERKASIISHLLAHDASSSKSQSQVKRARPSQQQQQRAALEGQQQRQSSFQVVCLLHSLQLFLLLMRTDLAKHWRKNIAALKPESGSGV